MKEVLTVRDLEFGYPRYAETDLGGEHLFQGLNFTMSKGEFLVLAGAPEEGKTTLARVICGLVPRFTGGRLRGDIRLLGEDIAGRNPQDLMDKVGTIFQDPDEQLITTRVDSEIAFPLESLGFEKAEIERRVKAELERFDLQNFASRNPATLSGGEKKRVLCAALAAVGPPLWIMDETLDEMDREWKDRVLTLLFETGTALLLLTSKISDFYQEYNPRHLLLSRGRILYSSQQIEKQALEDGLALEEPAGSIRIKPRPRTEPLLSVSRLRFSYASERGKPESKTTESKTTESETSKPDTFQPRREAKEKEKRRRPADFQLSVEELHLYPGEVVTLSGPNGCGKTTLAKLLCGLIKPAGGRIFLGDRGEVFETGRDDLRSRVAYMFQNPDYQIFLPTVEEELAYGLRELYRSEKKDKGKRNIEEEIEEAIKKGIEKFSLPPRDTPPSLMSYGSRKRLQAAVYWLLDRSICLFDEADSGLSKRDFARMVGLFQSPHRAILIITHDEEISRLYSHRVVRMESGEIVSVEDGNAR